MKVAQILTQSKCASNNMMVFRAEEDMEIRLEIITCSTGMQMQLANLGQVYLLRILTTAPITMVKLKISAKTHICKLRICVGHDTQPPPQECREFISSIVTKNCKMVTGCDASSADIPFGQFRIQRQRCVSVYIRFYYER